MRCAALLSYSVYACSEGGELRGAASELTAGSELDTRLSAGLT